MNHAPENLNWPESDLLLTVSVQNQDLVLTKQDQILFTAPVSTARNGTGSLEGSHQTPLGKFIVREKIGSGAPLGTNFKGRRPTHIWNPQSQEHDAILTGILWLHGLEEQNANTYQRYIYFHATHEEDLIGQPASCGCIRLRNDDMKKLFDLTPMFTQVQINGL